MALSFTNVLLLDNVDPSAKEILEKNGIQATLSKEKFSASDLITKLQDYDAIVVRSATKITEEVINACPKLKIIGRAGTGVDNIDIKAATKHGIADMNTPGGNTISAAEHTCTLICCLARNVPGADAHVKAGKWDRKAFMGHELYGKTLAIVGLGRIGLEVGKRMQSFGMATIGFDPIVPAEEAKKHGVKWMELKDIWPIADYVTVHTPLIPQTRGLINSDVFSKCKPGMRVINCARGGIIDENCMLEALKCGQCGGAGLDVFVTEPTTNMDLVSHPKVVACPHLGASTKEGQARCGSEIAQQFVDAKEGRSYFGILNAPALTAAVTEEAQSWIELVKRLGRIMRAFMKEKDGNKLILRTYGADLKKLGRALNAGAYAGLVDGDQCNLINASMLAMANGQQVDVEYKESAVNYCELEGTCCGMKIILSGKIIQNKPVITGINGVLSSPSQLNGSVLIYKSASSLNALQALVGVLMKEGISIKSLSTTQPGAREQWTVMSLSKPLADADSVQKNVEVAVVINF